MLELFVHHHLKIASKVTRLLALILQQHFDENTEQVTITIHSSLLPTSYATVPAMLARVLAPNTSYTSVRCVLRGEDLIISASDVEHPSSFRAKVMAGLNEKRRFVMKRINVPKSYRARPSLLTRSIVREFDTRIATIAKKKLIIWKLTNKPR